jgi:quinol monooxygenase YgiN
MSSDSVYVKMWEFIAKPEARAEFENLYGPDGKWVRFFRCSKGFLRTEFFRDRDNENRYVTLDYFTSKAAYDDFRREFQQEYEVLDRRCAAVTESEREIGAFTALGASILRAGA